MMNLKKKKDAIPNLVEGCGQTQIYTVISAISPSDSERGLTATSRTQPTTTSRTQPTAHIEDPARYIEDPGHIEGPQIPSEDPAHQSESDLDDHDSDDHSLGRSQSDCWSISPLGRGHVSLVGWNRLGVLGDLFFFIC